MKNINKVFAVLFTALFLISGVAMATPPGQDKGPAGYYMKVNGANAGEIKYFDNGHPGSPSEWEYVGSNPPVDPCPGGKCINTASAISIAAPIFIDGTNNPLGDATGGWHVLAAGNMLVNSYAQGTQFADAYALAFGKAFGFGFAAGIDTPHFGIGASGALAGVVLEGGGTAVGIDKFSFYKNPDFASVNIAYNGSAAQWNGILVDNGTGTFAGGFNTTGVSFYGLDFASDNGVGYVDLGRWGGFYTDSGFPAFSANCDGAFGVVGGYTYGSYIDLPGFAAAQSYTAGFSYGNADHVKVEGNGTAMHQAVANFGDTGSYGVSQGEASFCYKGDASFGAGFAKTSGYSTVTNGPHSSTVTATSRATSGSMIGGGYSQLK